MKATLRCLVISLLILLSLNSSTAIAMICQPQQSGEGARFYAASKAYSFSGITVDGVYAQWQYEDTYVGSYNIDLYAHQEWMMLHPLGYYWVEFGYLKGTWAGNQNCIFSFVRVSNGENHALNCNRAAYLEPFHSYNGYAISWNYSVNRWDMWIYHNNQWILIWQWMNAGNPPVYETIIGSEKSRCEDASSACNYVSHQYRSSALQWYAFGTGPALHYYWRNLTNSILFQGYQNTTTYDCWSDFC